MQYTGLNELREKYLSFFESKGHLRMKSFSLIPHNDKSLLLINSGMAPLKPYFTGAQEPPCRRVTTSQKCIRTPDIDRVGHTARHGTYFEMLGNFSFGDYFKRQAIAWAWEFVTKVLEIPEELLWATVYEQDDEAYEIWTKEVGLPESHLVRLGKADNFWEHGSGPCGPCSEIYFDRGEKYGCGSPDCKPGCDCDRFMEIWNNVFTQFDNDGNGNYTELASKNIDTGMGLERLACVMQGVDNLFEVDTVRRILDTVCSLAGKTYGEDKKDDISIRVITDHIRGSSFMICDGIIPSNEGRGYVLRRLIRRASRHGRLLGINDAFLSGLCEVVIRENESAYPELREKADYIKKVLSIEEQRFFQTIDSGLAILDTMIEKTLKENKKALSAEDSFKLYDTYGFPIDLTDEILGEKRLTLDREGFDRLMSVQRETARKNRSMGGGWDNAGQSALADLPATEFLGYTQDGAECKILAILVDNEKTDAVSEGDFTLVLDRTPFYGEGGGQVGDRGLITLGDVSVCVSDTKKTKEGVFFHLCTLVDDGVLRVGDVVVATVDTARRNAIRRNHSSVHLLQAALRRVLGSHVEQSGSYVDAERSRFDFSHFAAVTREELCEVERLVNEQILQGLLCETVVTDLESAQKAGAMALFGEKYQGDVRMVKMGDFSVELCGGTHVDNTSKIGLYKIVSESGIAAGIRRIEAVTGLGVLELLESEKAMVDGACRVLNVGNRNELGAKAEQLEKTLHEQKKLIEKLNAKLDAAQIATLESAIVEKNGLKLLFCRLEDMTPDRLRQSCDMLKTKFDSIVCVLCTVNEGKVMFAAACGKEALAKGAHAGNILKKISPIVGGGGGGRPDSATSGGKDPSRLGEAEKAFYELF